MNALFVTGTDTNVGKTLISKLLVRHFKGEGYSAIRQKWIETGYKGNCKDKDILPFTFKFPASPHLASRLENRAIDPEKIKRYFKRLRKRYDFVVVEGIGGALVPYNRKRFVIDIARELKLPVIIVVANKLGAINHTLLTIEAIKMRKMKILGIVYNNRYKAANKTILKDNINIIEHLTGVTTLGVIPYIKGLR